MDTARWWNILPSEFYNLNREDKLDCLALYEISWRIESINNYEQAEEAKRNAKKGGKGKKG